MGVQTQPPLTDAGVHGLPWCQAESNVVADLKYLIRPRSRNCTKSFDKYLLDPDHPNFYIQYLGIYQHLRSHRETFEDVVNATSGQACMLFPPLGITTTLVLHLKLGPHLTVRIYQT